MITKIKPYLMPIAMVTGVVFHSFFAMLAPVTPYLIFIMLFMTFVNLSFRSIRFTKLHFLLISIQLLGSMLVYLLISPFSVVIAQSIMICILAPTATSAPVITGMLQGNVASLATYSVLSNISVAIAAPLIFSLIGEYTEMPFLSSSLLIGKRIFLLLFLPLGLGLIVHHYFPMLRKKVVACSSLSFYIWIVALSIVTGRIVEFIMLQEASSYATEIIIATGALVIAVLQFLTGRRLGRKFDDTIAGGQGLGQKNTILAIWMAQTFLNPIASIGPGAYVLWQNIINSYQVWKKRKSL